MSNRMNTMDLVEKCKSVVYLNNAGVTFLERGQNRWALETYQIAIGIMDSIVRESTPTQDVTQLISLTAQRLSTHITTTSMNIIISLDVVSFDSSLEDIMDLLTGPKDTSIAGIRIDEMSSEDIMKDIQEFVPTILLTNYAVAHLSIPSNTECDLVARSLKLLDMAFSVLGFPRTLRADKVMDMSAEHLFLATVILHNIRHIHKATLQPDLQHQEYAFLKEILTHEFSMQSLGASAAAA